jgi:hypothetical protein
MRIRLIGLAAVVAAGALACGENNQQLPPGPRMQASAPTSPSVTCDFKSLSQLATHYFPGQEAKIVKDIISQMQTAGAYTSGAQNYGFDVMTHVAANIKAGNTDVSDGSNLTNGLLACMYDATTTAGQAALPATFPEDFTVAVDPAQHGGYEVRGGPNDLTAVVFSRPLSSPFSGVAPSTGITAADWSGMLGTPNPPPNRILVYGEPSPLPETYDWRVVPRNTAFNPVANVGLCLDVNQYDQSLVHEEHVGLLPFVDFPYLIAGQCSSVASAGSSPWPFQLARTLTRWMAPRPLWAAGTLNPGGLGGATDGIHSEFGPQLVDTVYLAFVQQPTDVQVNQIITPPVQVSVTAVKTGDPVPNVTVTLSSINNNGTPALLSGTLTKTTDGTGILTFSDLSESKTGGYVLVATGTVGNRDKIYVPAATSDRFNVRP